MFSATQYQSKTNINLSQQGVIQLRRGPFYLSLFIYLLSTTLEVQTLSQACLGLKINF